MQVKVKCKRCLETKKTNFQKRERSSEDKNKSQKIFPLTKESKTCSMS